MGAKRAVAGRSLPYDMLLAAYQKKNQAKQQSTLRIIQVLWGTWTADTVPQRLLWTQTRLWRTKTKPMRGRLTRTKKQPLLWVHWRTGTHSLWCRSLCSTRSKDSIT
ncbi:nuclear protein Ataxin-7 [Colletotrichum musicola]|uniref:Nuclear protein Ataxin-7 n=1 Tax=Colletotrichum musicola TaxID=2175873 RepID=A0A8H6U839_9PEZI|nr:nuclear protein Ataxin-7 [Colletotrichum musicola]